jgi:hypothetical protein
MANYDRKFEIVRPSLDKLTRASLELANPLLAGPTPASGVPFIPGELVTFDATYKLIRATVDTAPSYFVIDDRGDTGVQASRKLSVVMLGTFEADTIVFDTTLTTLFTPVKLGTVNNATIGGVNRSGLVDQAGSGIILGYITRVAASNGGRLRFHKTFA